jgi:MarC family membrane protein
MSGLINFGVLAFTSLLAIVNPISAVPVFLAMTANYAPSQRRRTIRRAVITAAAILFVFAILGSAILQFFGITTYAFKIAGGILFFFIGWDMLQARRSRSKTTPEEEVEGAEKEDIGIIPLGIPTLAGPGAITTVIALMGQRAGLAAGFFVYAAIIAALGVSWLVLLAAPALLRTFGQTGLNVMTRLMGLLVMVVGVQFVIDGVRVVVQEFHTMH